MVGGASASCVAQSSRNSGAAMNPGSGRGSLPIIAATVE